MDEYHTQTQTPISLLLTVLFDFSFGPFIADTLYNCIIRQSVVGITRKYKMDIVTHTRANVPHQR